MVEGFFETTKMKDINATVIVNLKLSETEILQGLHKDARWGINKAKKEGLQVKEGNEKDWEEFYEFYKTTMDLGGVEFEDLEKLKKNTLILFVCKKEEKIIAGAGIKIEELNGSKIPRLYINASMKEYLHLQPNNLLYWNCLIWGKSKGYSLFDLGGWQINPKGHLKGINKFKEKWGKIVYYQKDYPFFIALGRKLIRNSSTGRFLWDRVKKRPLYKEDKNIENKKAYGTKESINLYSSDLRGVSESEKKLIKKYFHGKILDLGCGCGRTTKYLFEENYDVIGVELVEEMVKVAKNKYPKIKFKTGDACCLDFPEESFDIVFFSYNGLDYIYPEEKRILAIKEIARVLKKGGLFVYSSHNPRALLKQIRPKFIFRNLLKASIFSKYKYEKQNFGELYTYYASPKNQQKLVEKASKLKLIEIYIDRKDKLHPHYVFKNII